MTKTYWFKRKTYGWGWTPSSWEGWFCVFVWALFFTFTMLTLDHEWLKNMIVIFFITGVLILVCFIKGEKPKWQWGSKK